ncbi:MAG: polysaccharide deacetylase family protein [Desulfitobacteriaceae bacterium]
MSKSKLIGMLILLSAFLGGSLLFGAAGIGEANSSDKSEKNYGNWKFTSSLRQHKDLLFEVITTEKLIALTFDDGPDESTEEILDVLKKYNVKATFFVVGKNCLERIDTLKRISLEGHEVGNHTYTHPKFRAKSCEQISQELEKTSQVIFQTINYFPQYFRPPGGTINLRILEAAKAQHLRIVLWTPEEDSKDWQNPGVATIVRNVTKNAKGGSIILMHDGGGARKQTIDALPRIIEQLEADGYQFATLSDLLQAKNSIPVDRNKY